MHTRALCLALTLFHPALSGCASSPRPSIPVATATHRPAITTKHGSGDELQTKRQLEALLDCYDLGPWMFAPAIEIDRDVTPHSHPVLTLHTRHLRDDLLLLSTLIHEESHWYFVQHAQATTAAVENLKKEFPSLPVGYPDGANNLQSSYEHLLVILCEWRGVLDLLGELKARQVMQFWATDHYRVLYRLVLENADRIRDVLKGSGLEIPHSKVVL